MKITYTTLRGPFAILSEVGHLRLSMKAFRGGLEMAKRRDSNKGGKRKAPISSSLPVLKPGDFQSMLDLINSGMNRDEEDGGKGGEGLAVPERVLMRFDQGLSVEIEMSKSFCCWTPRHEDEAVALDQIYSNWRAYLETDLRMFWHPDLQRYVGSSQESYLKGETRILLEHFPEYLAECGNCQKFFMRTSRRAGKRRQKFCCDACRRDNDKKQRKTPEGRRKRAKYQKIYRDVFM
jgi:hypothetical protein